MLLDDSGLTCNETIRCHGSQTCLMFVCVNMYKERWIEIDRLAGNRSIFNGTVH
jgi:hypothetical protein